MSQKQAKRIRRLERRVSALENLAMSTIANGQDRALRAENELAGMVMDAEWMPDRPKPGILRRIAGFFDGR